MIINKLKKEIKSLKVFWKNGTSRAQLGWKKACRLSKFQDLEQIVSICIIPYITPKTTILEIGADGGFWTQKMLNAGQLFCIDISDPIHTGFWKRIPKREYIKYFTVSDFSCSVFKDNTIDYIFSYDVFCHISYSGAEAYLKNLYNKLKFGANCFIMIADADKYYDIKGKQKLMLQAGFKNLETFIKDYDGPPNNGRWYFYGIEKFCKLLNKYNYKLISKDVVKKADKLNPIIHFRK